MDIVQFVCMWLAGFLTLIICDYLFLGIAVKDIIIEDFKPYVEVKDGSVQVKLGIGLLAWAIISLGCVYFVSMQAVSIPNVLMLGAFFGFILYGCYDLTNLTFFTKYSVRWVVMDIIWGTILCSLVSLSGFLVRRFAFGGI